MQESFSSLPSVKITKMRGLCDFVLNSIETLNESQMQKTRNAVNLQRTKHNKETCKLKNKIVC